MKDTNIYVNKKLVYENEITEIDFVLHDEFGYDYEKHEDFIIHTESEGYGESYPINIDSVIQELSKMKESGATHVEITYHCDHIGYIFEGYQITKLTESDVSQLKKNEETEAERLKRERIEDLKKQIQMLENDSYL